MGELRGPPADLPPAAPWQEDEVKLPVWEVVVVAMALSAVLAVVYWNVVFSGGSLVYSNNYNPMAPGNPPSYGPDSVPLKEWSERNLLL